MNNVFSDIFASSVEKTFGARGRIGETISIFAVDGENSIFAVDGEILELAAGVGAFIRLSNATRSFVQ